jgi:hypothetical protein
MRTNRTLSDLAVAMMALPFVLGTALCYLRPDRAWIWAIGMLLLPAAWAMKARLKNADARKRVCYAVIFSSVAISISLGSSLAAALGLIDEPTVRAIGDRLTNVLAGLFLVFLGNQLPKMLPPLPHAPRDAATIQSVRRRIGWTHVLSGLALAILWLVLPVQLARPIGIAIIVVGILVPAAVMRFCCAGLANRASFP